MENHEATTITTKLAVAWATLPANRHASWALRLTDVRGFARHVATFNPETEIPPTGILPPLKRARPYLYSDTEISALMAAAPALPPADGLRRWTYHHLFGLFAVTGIRLSEAIRLWKSDVDLDDGLLTIKQSKFGKLRIVPLHPTVSAALRSYAQRRDAHLGSRCEPHSLWLSAAAPCFISMFIVSFGNCPVRLGRESAAALDIERLVNSFVRYAHGFIIREVGLQPIGNLFGRPAIDPSAVTAMRFFSSFERHWSRPRNLTAISVAHLTPNALAHSGAAAG